MKLKNKSVLLSILVFFILFGPGPIYAFTTTVYTDQFTGVSVHSDDDNRIIQTYSDGTALMTFAYTDPLKKGIPVVRLIHANGSVTAFDVPFNCNDSEKNCPAISYPLGSNYIFMTYKTNGVDKNIYGLIVDWNGNILFSDMPLGQADSFSETTFQPNIDPEINFLWTNSYKYKDVNQISWIVFSNPNASGKIDILYQGIFTTSNSTVLGGYTTFPTIEGGFGLAYFTQVAQLAPDFRNSLQLSSKPQYYIYVTFLQPGSVDFNEPALIYQTSIPFSSFFLKSCYAAKDASGYGCIYFTPTTNGYDFMLISFLSSGSVSVVWQIVDGNATTVEEVTQVTPLPYGGFLTATVDVSTIGGTGFIGHLSYSNGTVMQDIRLPIATNIYTVFPNNTLCVPYVNNGILTMYMESLPKFLQDDTGFGNLLIDSATPPLKSVISSDIQNITVTFRQEILLSFRNVSIYQYTTADPILRQTFTAQSQYCSLLSDNKTVSFQVLSSTFNSPSSSYYIIMDNNFVSSKIQNQPFIGVSKGYWTYTAGIVKGKYTATSTGLLRLTPDGSTFFNSFGKDDKENFFNEILHELSEVIPIDITRLSTSKRHQFDPKATNQILFPITIKSTKDSSKRTGQQVINDLDILVKNKGISPISFKKFTSYLDGTYGFQPTPNLWESYKLKLIYVAIGIIILGAIYAVAWRKNRKGQNFIIIKIALMLLDLILDITFVIINGKDVIRLFLPSVLFLVIPITFNGTIAFILLISETSTNKKFYGWFQNNSKSMAFLTILAATDIEAITLISSKLFGLQMFSAPFSIRAESWIFWVGFCNLFIEDIPQLVIQILYRQYTVSYDIIPFLTLIMSSIILTSNVISYIYRGIHKCYGHYFNLTLNTEIKENEK